MGLVPTSLWRYEAPYRCKDYAMKLGDNLRNGVLLNMVDFGCSANLGKMLSMLVVQKFQVFFQAKPQTLYFHGVFRGDIAIVPWFVGYSGDGCFILGET